MLRAKEIFLHAIGLPTLDWAMVLDDTGSNPEWGRSCVSGKCPDWLWGLASLVFSGYKVLFWWH